MGSRSNALKFNPIDFDREDVSETGFGLGGDVDEQAFEFNVSVNKHGRVHGYFVENIFYIVWLDPQHSLCP